MQPEVIGPVDDLRCIQWLQFALEFEQIDVKLIELHFDPGGRRNGQVVDRDQPDRQRLGHRRAPVVNRLEFEVGLFQFHLDKCTVCNDGAAIGNRGKCDSHRKGTINSYDPHRYWPI